MKIYFITSKLNFATSGGSVTEFDLMIRTLQDLGNEVIAITAFSRNNVIPGPLPYQVIEEHIKSRGLIGIQIEAYALLRKYEHDADFFHVDGHLFLYAAGAYRRFGGTVPISAFFNRELGSWPEDRSALIDATKKNLWQRAKGTVRRQIERSLGMFLASGIDLCSFITPHYQALYESFGLHPKNDSFILGDPVDLKRLMRENSITEHSYRDRIGRNEQLRIFFSSRMVPGKGFDLLLAGFSRISDRDRYRLVLGGSGPEEMKLRHLTEHLGISSRVDFLGWLSQQQLYDEMKKADMFVQVGWRKEGASMTLLHAMAFGLPSIVPCGGGLAWQAHESALCVTNGNHDELAQGIERLGNEPELRARLSAGCYARINDPQMDHQEVIGRWFKKMQDIRTHSPY